MLTRTPQVRAGQRSAGLDSLVLKTDKEFSTSLFLEFAAVCLRIPEQGSNCLVFGHQWRQRASPFPGNHFQPFGYKLFLKNMVFCVSQICLLFRITLQKSNSRLSKLQDLSNESFDQSAAWTKVLQDSTPKFQTQTQPKTGFTRIYTKAFSIKHFLRKIFFL